MVTRFTRKSLSRIVYSLSVETFLERNYKIKETRVSVHIMKPFLLFFTLRNNTLFLEQIEKRFTAW